MSDPAGISVPQPPGSSRDPGASPLAAFPGLDRLVHGAGDIVLVTDLDRRVVLWNAHAAEMYGIPEAQALGRSVAELWDSTIAGQDTDASGARRLAISDGFWRGRLVDRPRFGPRAGQEFTVETALSRLDDENGALVGILSIKRDVTTAVRGETELATLAAVALAVEAARSRRSIAEGVLDRLIRATGATMGVVTSHDGPEPRIEASRGMPAELRTYMETAPRDASPLSQSLQAPGATIAGPVESLPMLEQTRAFLHGVGIEALAGVGLHRRGEYVGLLLLAYTDQAAAVPSSAMLVQAAAHLQRALDSVALTDQLAGREAAERRLADQQLALQSLTELSDTGDDFGSLARRTAEQVGSALGSVAGCYVLLDPEGAGIDVFDWNSPPAIRDRLRALTLDPSTPLRRFSQGEGAFLEAYEPGTVSRAESLELARSVGWTGYAALPVVIAGRLEGILIMFFDRPMETLGLDSTGLDAIARLASISLANFRLRERLVASEGRYRTIFQSSPEPYFVETLDGWVLAANAAAGRVFRASPDELLGLSVEQLAEIDRSEIDRRGIVAMAEGSATFRGVGIRMDGTAFPQEVTVSVVDLEGERRALVLVRDLSEQDRLQQELIQAQKMDAIGQLVSGVAHELNNPLAAILGFSQLIRVDPSLPEELRHDAGLLVEEATRTQRIVGNLLDFARQRPPERYPTSIKALIDAVLLLQAYTLGADQIAVELDIPEDLPVVELDRSQIQQVLVNLTQNAIHAIQAKGTGRLAISAHEVDGHDGPCIRVAVADDGIGVASDDVAKLFMPFFTTKAPSEGTGLGLPVSLGIVASHGGELRYEPGPDGRGAVFTFDLPVRASLPEDAGDGLVREATGSTGTAGAAGGDSREAPGYDGRARRRAAPRSPGRAAAVQAPSARPASRILVLDDERSIRLLLEKWLRGSGYEPVIAVTGEEAVELVRGGPFDAILCDHRMAGMSGTDVFEAVVALRPELDRRFVFMSGDVLNPQLRGFVQDRGVSLLAKPFDLETVHRTLDAVLVGARAAPD